MTFEPFPDADSAVVRAYVDALAAVSRSRAATDALEAALLADLVELSGASGRSSEADLSLRSFAAEVGAAVRVSDRTVQHRMSDAYQLVHGFPSVHQALSRGEITLAHARVLVDVGLPVSAGPAREEFVRRVLPLARVESPNRLRGMVAQVAEEVRDVGITARHREARRARAVWVTDHLDGMSTLHAHLPSLLAHGIKDRLDQMAHALRDTHAAATSSARVVAGADAGPRMDEAADANADPTPNEDDAADTRTVDQIRADLLADLLLTSTPGGVTSAIGSIRATVAVTIPVLTLTGREETGAELDGITPIDAETARLLAGGQSGWDRILTHPITGTVLTTDRYRPTAGMRRLLTHRDQHCRHPGCRVPARHTDLDHNHEWAHGGKTTTTNLAPLCRRHHSLKTHAGWTITPHPDGTVEFTTPAGYRYTDTPPRPTTTFTPTTGEGGPITRGDCGDRAPTTPDDPPPW